MTEQIYDKLPKRLYNELTDLIDSGKVINAIKHMRNSTKSLTEAKKIVDVIRYCKYSIIIKDEEVSVPRIDVFANTKKRKRDYAKVGNYMES